MKKMLLNFSKKLGTPPLLSIVFFLFVSMGMAQVSVSGKVTDAKTNVPLPGVNIFIEGSNIATNTDFDGKFSIQTKKGNNLVFSYLGFVTKKIVVIKDETNLLIALDEDAKVLDEVIVVGYGTKLKKKMISAVSTIDTETLMKVPVPTVSNALEGLASGLFVRQTSGEPGFSTSSFEVRNFGSALVIVDGAPGDLNQLDPNEIESISVLKDAAAAAVYGVQGGNGVVLIETKVGKIGKPKLRYSNQFTYTGLTSYPEFLTSAQYAEIYNEGLRNGGQNPKFSDEQIEAYKSGSDPVNYPNTDWRSLILKDWGFQQRHNLNLSGGTEDVSYFVSGGFLGQGSNYTQDVLSYQQFNLRTNFKAKISDNLKLTFALAGRRRINEAPAFSANQIFQELSRALPTDLAYYPDGTPAKPSFSPVNIVEGMKDFNAGYYRVKNNNIDAKISLKWDVNQVKGLSLKSYASLIYDTSFTKDWGKNYNIYNLNRLTGNYDVSIAKPIGAFSNTILDESFNYSNHYVLQESINYDRSFGNHNVSALLLTEIQKRQGENFNARRQDFQATTVDQLYAGSIENQGANGGEFRENRIGYIGRFSYDYKSKYFIETSFRHDGSSRFASGHQWGLYPSVSLGWRLSEESFFEPLKNTISNLKLRGSVGTAGFDDVNAYQWVAGFVYSGFYVINNKTVPTIDNTALANTRITWETNTTYDIGLDAEFFNKELKFSFDYFHRKREDVLSQGVASVPSTLGVALADQNLKTFSNSGFEFSLEYAKKINSNLKVFGLLNFSKSREKAVFIDETPQTDPFMKKNLTITGGYTNLRRGYISDGLFQTQDEINQYAIQDNQGNASLQPGDIKFKDLNGDNIIDVKDQKVFGNGDKAATNYSLNLGAEYKNFGVSVLLTGAGGYDLYLDGEAQSPLRNGFNGYGYQVDYWTPENTDAKYPRITNGGFNTNNSRYSDYWLRNGAHIRFKNINLSYKLPKSKWTSSFDEIKFFATGYNLFVIKKYSEGFDPQSNSSNGWSYPQTKSISFGVNISL
jgi:TonB-linked SusC/RagA family outer membrane protein